MNYKILQNSFLFFISFVKLQFTIVNKSFTIAFLELHVTIKRRRLKCAQQSHFQFPPLEKRSVFSGPIIEDTKFSKGLPGFVFRTEQADNDELIIILLVRYLRNLPKKPEIQYLFAYLSGYQFIVYVVKTEKKSEFSQIVLTSIVLSKRNSDWFLSVIVITFTF